MKYRRNRYVRMAVLIFMGLILVYVIPTFFNKQNNVVEYPNPVPDSIPLKFLPGVVTSNELDFNSSFSPDGKSFYFGRSKNGKWVMYVTSFDGHRWTTPVRPVFNDITYSEADPAFAPDGTLYYISSRPKNETDTIKDYDIWFVKPLANGQWTKPENLSVVNSDSDEFYISFADNSNLYFSSSRPGGFGQEDIYSCKYVNETYSRPFNLGSAINSPGSDHDPLISKDDQLLVFTSSERKDGYGEADLYHSKRMLEDVWRPAANLGKRFNTSTYEYCPYLTPDQEYFFYSSESDVKWIKSEYLLQEIEK